MPKAIGCHKYCPSCKKTKHISEFGPSDRYVDQLKSWCKMCCNLESARQRQRHNHPKVPRQSWMTCKVDGCDNVVRSRYGTLCNKHYFRGRRTGTTADRPRSPPSLSNHGYLVSQNKGHPASSSNGLLYEHRRVFYETNGPHGHSCFWCGIPLQWGGAGQGKIHIDHLDAVKTNNDISNLVASCLQCNSNRGLFMKWAEAHADDPVLLNMLRSV